MTERTKGHRKARGDQEQLPPPAGQDADATAAPDLPIPAADAVGESVGAELAPPCPAKAEAPTDEEAAAYNSDPELGRMFVTDAIDHLRTIEAVLLKLDATPGDVKLLNDLFRPFHTVKGNAGALGFMSIQAVAHKVETLLDLARSGHHAIGPAEIDVVLKAVDLLTLMAQDLPARAAGQPPADFGERRGLLMDAVEALIAAPATPPAATPTEPATRAASEPSAQAREEHPAPPAHEAAATSEEVSPHRRWDDGQNTVKVNTDKLDALVDLVGELVIAQSILAADPSLAGSANDRVNRQLAQIKRITSELQRQAMSMRMVPIRQTFQKMARLVRDLSRKSGKAIDLVLAGEETELDRKVVEQLNDPLMHMVRNTIDHGVEPADVRAAAGKPAQAQLHLSAYHQGGAIVIEVADDGSGLNTQKILERGIAQGLIGAQDALTPADIHELIFRPGFSTAETVTELSGRGVGMDVVRRNIEALRGRIDIRTAQGEGTTFTLRLPLTLATVDGLMLAVGAQRFIIPAFAVRESLRPSAEQLHTVRGGRAAMLLLRERLIPVLHLGGLFRVPGARPAITDATVIVIEDNGRQAALVVDELIGKQEVVIKTLGEMFQGIRGVAGGAILGDGRIGLILDAGGLLAMIDRDVLPAVA